MTAPTNTLTEMLAELEAHKLEVALAPSKRAENPWDMVRVVVNKPPAWYRRLCARHESSRRVRRGKFDTRVKRANILALLSRLADGKPSVSKYAAELLAEAKKRENAPF